MPFRPIPQSVKREIELEDEITRLKELVREMGEALNKLNPRCNHPINDRPEVKAILIKPGSPGDSGGEMTRQEGGDHYLRLPIQPWEIIERCNLDFFEGNVIKYILRRKEDRLTDLKKARHYLDHLIEREEFLQDKH